MRLVYILFFVYLAIVSPALAADSTALILQQNFDSNFVRLASGWKINAWGGGSAEGMMEKRASFVYQGIGSQMYKVTNLTSGGADLVYDYPFKRGSVYRASFYVRSEQAQNIVAQIRRGPNPYNTVVKKSVTVGTSWQKVELVGTYAFSDIGGVRISLQSAGQIWIDNFELTEILTSDSMTIPIPADVDNRSFDRLLLSSQFDLGPFNNGMGSGWYFATSGGVPFEASQETNPNFVYSGVGSQRFKILSAADGKYVTPRLNYEFKKGKTYKATLWMKSESSTKVKIQIRHDVHPWDPAVFKEVVLGTTWQQITLQGTFIRDVAGSLRIDPEVGKAIYFEDMKLYEVDENPIAPILSSAIPGSLFGVHVNQLGQHNEWPELGQNIIRLWNTGTTWKDLQPTATWDFSNSAFRRLDLYANYAVNSLHKVPLLYTLGMTPRWASTSPDVSGLYGLGSTGAPKDMNTWRSYVRTLAERYKGRILYWELWNEPDYVQGHYTGTMPEMIEMARIAFEVLKSVDINNKLFSPGVTSAQGYMWTHRFLSAGGARYIDGVAAHWYYGHSPEDRIAMMKNYRQLMKDFGVSHLPLWNTEGSSVCNVEGVSCDPLPDAETRTVNFRMMALMASMGITNFNFHTMEGMSEESRLVLDDFRTLSPQGEGYRIAKDWLQGAVIVNSYIVAGDIYIYRLKRNNMFYSIVWTTGVSKTIELPMEWKAKTFKRMNQPVNLVPSSRQLRLSLEPILLQ